MSLWAFTGAAVIAAAAYLILSGFLATYRKFRGVRVITCPENLHPAAVRVNALRAAHWAAVSGEAAVRLAACSRWPEKEGCAQECLSQITPHPESCLLHTIASSWYEGRHCVYCNREIGEIVWHERPPALRAPDGTSREWSEIAPEQLPEIFQTHEPVCWTCFILEGFRREHPEWIVKREIPHPVEPPLNPSVAVY